MEVYCIMPVIIELSKYSNIENAIGEVLSIDGNRITIYVYPERFQDISMGDMLIVKSDYVNPILVIDRNIHKARREQGFTPIRVGIEEFRRLYPDSEYYYMYVTSGLYVSYADSNGVLFLSIGASPNVHDLAFKLDSNDRIKLFLKGSEISFDILRYIFWDKIDIMLFREFLIKNIDVLRKLGSIAELIGPLSRSIITLTRNHVVFKNLIKEFIEVLSNM